MILEFFKNYEFFVGVPDSLLSPFCDYLYDEYGLNSKKHFVAANEGTALGIALGYHLATSKIPVVYLQNSGIGNIINPLTSLLNEKIYKIPCVFVIGLRGQSGIKDEPQHAFMGQITTQILQDCGIYSFVVSKNTSENELKKVNLEFQELLKNGKQVAFVIEKDVLENSKKVSYSNDFSINREDAIKQIMKIFDSSIFVATTGKISRELFEAREQEKQSHEKDFLCVGGMGHASSIAFGIALKQENQKIICLDGDGAFLMHTGALGLIGTSGIKNFIHIVLNNSSHESVGGMPTIAAGIDLCKIASGFGYKHTFSIENENEIEIALQKAKILNELCFIEIKCAIFSRKDLMRPTISPEQNKIAFMKQFYN